MIQPHEEQAERNHGQSLERLAERGGLGCYEAICVLEDRIITFHEARSKSDNEWMLLLKTVIQTLKPRQ